MVEISELKIFIDFDKNKFKISKWPKNNLVSFEGNFTKKLKIEQYCANNYKIYVKTNKTAENVSITFNKVLNRKSNLIKFRIIIICNIKLNTLAYYFGKK